MITDPVPDHEQIKTGKTPQNGRLFFDDTAGLEENERRILSAAHGPSERIETCRIAQTVPFIEVYAGQKDARVEIIFMKIAEPSEYLLGLLVMLGERSQIQRSGIAEQVLAPVLVLEYHAESGDSLRHMPVLYLHPYLYQPVSYCLLPEGLQIRKAFFGLGHEPGLRDLVHPQIEVIGEQLHLYIAHPALLKPALHVCGRIFDYNGDDQMFPHGNDLDPSEIRSAVKRPGIHGHFELKFIALEIVCPNDLSLDAEEITLCLHRKLGIAPGVLLQDNAAGKGPLRHIPGKLRNIGGNVHGLFLARGDKQLLKGKRDIARAKQSPVEIVKFGIVEGKRPSEFFGLKEVLCLRPVGLGKARKVIEIGCGPDGSIAGRNLDFCHKRNIEFSEFGNYRDMSLYAVVYIKMCSVKGIVYRIFRAREGIAVKREQTVAGIDQALEGSICG